MPRRELLTEQQRLNFSAPATDERTMVRHYTLSSDDMALIDRRRGDHNRLGFAVLFCYLRFPGRVLQADEQPPMAMLDFVARQLSLDPATFGVVSPNPRNFPQTSIRCATPSQFPPEWRPNQLDGACHGTCSAQENAGAPMLPVTFV